MCQLENLASCDIIILAFRKESLKELPSRLVELQNNILELKDIVLTLKMLILKANTLSQQIQMTP